MAEELERDLGLVSVIAISMGAMIGSGIFILPGLAMAEAGPAVILAFVIAAILVVPAAVSIAELGTALPEAGGDYIFIERGMGPAAGTIAGLGTWLMLMFKGALALVGGMLYLAPIITYFGLEVTEFHLELLAVVVGIILITVNVIGVKQTGGLQKILVVLMLFILGGFVGLNIGSVEAESYTGFFEAGTVGLLSATAMVLISYGGVTKVAAVAEEIEDPGRNLPLGLLLSLGITTGLYALIVFVLVGTVDAATLEGSEVPMVDGVEPVFGIIAVVLVVVAAMAALISTANAGILTASRYPFALSRDNLLPDTFGAVSERFRTPVPAILTTGIAMIVIILALPVEEIAKTAGAFQIVVYVLVCLSLIAFRIKDPEWYEPEFRSPLYPWIQLFGVVSGVFILTQMDTLPLIGGVGIVALGALWYAYYGRARVDRTGIVSDAIIEEIEPEPERKPHRIVVPVANPETERDLIRVAAAEARTHDDAELVVMNVVTVPEQTALAQEVAKEKQRLEAQQELLAVAESIVDEYEVGFRTRSIVGRSVADAVLHVVDDEAADGLVMGWSGQFKRREHVLGSNIDRILEQAPCTVSLVRPGTTVGGDIVAFVGEGPYTQYTIDKAQTIKTMDPASSLQLVNIQDPGTDPEAARERGESVIESAIAEADPDAVATDVVLDADVEGAIETIANRHDTTVIGVSRASTLERLVSGAIPERLGESVDGTLVLVRGPETTTRSVWQAIRRRVAEGA